MSRTYGYTASQVVDRFLAGKPGGTAAAPVPGGRRVESMPEPHRPGTALYSYRTIVAVREEQGDQVIYALTPRKYGPSTSKLMGRVRAALYSAGYYPQVEQDGSPITQGVYTAVPGRWGGFGPAWAPHPFETLPFQVWKKETWR